jgi:hypothetical protein
MKEFKLSEEHIDEIIRCNDPKNLPAVWKHLGEVLGFKGDTVEPVPGKGLAFFKAEPIVTDAPKEKKEEIKAPPKTEKK